MDLNEIINRIGYFRNKKNLSARELSLLIGKHGGYINKLENKDFNLPTSVLLKILETLNISCEEFFADNYADYEQDKEIFDLLNALPAERKKSFIDLMKNTK